MATAVTKKSNRVSYGRVDITLPGSGLFRVLSTQYIAEQSRVLREGGTAQSITKRVKHGDVTYVFVAAYILSDFDLRVLTAVAGLAGIAGETRNAEGAAEKPRFVNLWDQFLTLPDSSYKDTIRLRTTVYELLREIGEQDGGRQRERLVDSLTKLALVGQYIEKGRKRLAGDGRVIKYAHDSDSREIAIDLSPMLTRVILNQSLQYLALSVEEQRALQSPAAVLMHAYLSSIVRPDAKVAQRVSLDDIISAVYGPVEDDEDGSVMRKRRFQINAAAAEIRQLDGWSIVSQGKKHVLVQRVSAQRLEKIRRRELLEAAEAEQRAKTHPALRGPAIDDPDRDVEG